MLFGAVIGLTVAVVLILLTKRAQKLSAEQNPMDFVVVAPQFMTWIGVIAVGLAVAGVWFLLARTNLAQESAGLLITSLVLLLLFLGCGIVLLLIGLRERLYVRDDTLEYQGIFGKSRYMQFRDITRVRQKLTGIQVYVGDKKMFGFDYSYIGYTTLLQRLAAEGLYPIS